ncbi:MAG: hypothetical protein IPL01_21215 [Acidobacteria bacterium]|nr:hypothetical protein [Acidobacteriota bacterium]
MQNQQEKNQPCGEPPWDQAIGPNGIYNQLLNPIGVAHNWIENAHTYRITNSGSFSDFEGRVKVNGWERFSNDPHLDHWGDNDYRKQYNGEWYHFSMGRPGKTLIQILPVLLGLAYTGRKQNQVVQGTFRILLHHGYSGFQ